MKIFRLLGKLLLWLLGIVLGVAVVGLVIAWFADPAVVRNTFFGPKHGRRHPGRAGAAAGGRAGRRTRRPSAVGPPDTIEPAALAAAEAYAAQTHSVALLVYHRGALRYEKYWPGYDRNFLTDPFSAHKTVMGLLYGAAVADGFIESVDQPASTWLPEWRNDSRRDIRLRDLLQMSSGLELPVFGTWRGFRVTLGSDLASVVLPLKPEKPPGTDFQYSNANAAAARHRAAAGHRQALCAVPSERLWSRIGAPDRRRSGSTARVACRAPSAASTRPRGAGCTSAG